MEQWKLAKVRLDGVQFRHRFVDHALEIQDEASGFSVRIPIMDCCKELPRDNATALEVIQIFYH